MTFMRLLIVMPFMLSLAFAKELKIVTITSDFDQLTTAFLLELKEENVIDSMRIIRSLPTGQITDDESHPAERVVREGTVLYKQSGYEIVRLKLEKFDLKLGGIVVLDYLYNGVTGSRMKLRFNLKTMAEGSFELQDAHGKKVNRLFIIAHRTPLGVVGIREIRVVP